MRIELGFKVWGFFFGFCRIYGNVELVECVSRRLFVFESKNVGNYVLLVDIYVEV